MKELEGEHYPYITPFTMKNFFSIKKQPVTVSTIISDFKTKIEQLHSLNTERKDKIAANKDTIAQLDADNKSHEAEATLALSVAEKLKFLVS